MSTLIRVIASLLLGAWALSCNANEAVLRQLVSAYNAGDIAALPLTDDATLDGEAARARFAAKFAKAKHRMLILQLVRCSTTRCTSNYYEATGPDLRAGSMTAYLETGGRISRIVQDDRVWPAGNGSSVADAAQIADKASTAAALASGMSESNPVLHGISGAGMLGLGAVIIGARHLIVRELPLSDCIDTTRMLSATGAAGGVNNILLLTGVAAPIAPVAGAIAGVVSYRGNYRDECTDDDVRVAEIK